jgi:hypothetical protein
MSQIGTIDCGYLAMIQGQMDVLWTDPMQNVDLIADVESARAVLTNQRVNMTEILGRKEPYRLSGCRSAMLQLLTVVMTVTSLVRM